jgi:endonuclease YncB( thermonuclease family)
MLADRLQREAPAHDRETRRRSAQRIGRGAHPTNAAHVHPRNRLTSLRLFALVVACGALALAPASSVIDGDTIALANGQRVRLVQTETPETCFEPECYGRRATQAARRLLPVGTFGRLDVEP